MKPETIQRIRKLLKEEADNKRAVMMRYIEGWHNGLDEVINEYRGAYSALNDFDDWMDEQSEED